MNSNSSNRGLVFGLAFGAGMLASSLGASAQPYSIAFLAASSENGFNQAVYQGAKEAADAMGNVTVDIFNGEFNATLQYSQVEDVLASGKYQGMIILPNDSVGIATAVDEAVKGGMKVATTLFPLGPKLDTLEPQIPGLVTTVASNPAKGAKAEADAVVDFCADKDPCKVVIMIGQLIYPFDKLRYDTFTSTLAGHPNIQVVATVEGNYDPDKSLTGMQDVLQSHKDIDVVLSNADQHLVGAEIALEDAGIDVPPLFLIGGGANQIAIDAIRAGRWDATLAEFPKSMGKKALEGVVGALEGKEVPAYTDASTIGGVPYLINKEILDAHPDFKAEWQG
jgi:ribose transport system substrate-binding protein